MDYGLSPLFTRVNTRTRSFKDETKWPVYCVT
jgi:hypothetical protein